MDSERLAQEDLLLRQIRLVISSLNTTRSSERRRKGAMYASTAITTGKRSYEVMRRLGFKSAEEFKKTDPAQFSALVMKPNLQDGNEFGELLRKHGWPLTIVPGMFWAPDWGQTHYMSFWRTVINLFTRSICHNTDWAYSNGSVEEFLIALRCNVDGKEHKRIFVRRDNLIILADPRTCADEVRRAIDQIIVWGFNPSSLYELWREIVLTIDVTIELARKST